MRDRVPSFLLAAALVASVSAQGATTNYTALTNPFSATTNFNVETVRGLAFDALGAQLWAVNTHGSMLARLTLPGGTPTTQLFRTLNNPVALAIWPTTAAQRYIFVVGGGTHGLAVHAESTGEIVAFLNLPSEPSDIVIDEQRAMAFVCSTAEEVVTAIDLPTLVAGNPLPLVDIPVPGTRPVFLAFDPGSSPSVADNVVRVTPMLSGNNTTQDGQNFAHVVRLPTGAGLPDEDLFEINTTTFALTTVFRGVGTLLTAHGRNPATNRYWMLGTESVNDKSTEPNLNGAFAQNRLVTAQLGQPVQPADIKSLDTTTATLVPAQLPGEPSANKPLSFPFGLAFRNDGIAAIAGSTGDTIRLLSSTAGNLKNVALPGGSIPRSLLFSPDGATLWVYCWGTNKVMGFDFNALLSQTTTSATATWDLGADPQPTAVKEGRKLWYDADNSANHGLSCNHCHPRGGTDMLGWQLSGVPFDHKGVMVTQSLLSIEDTFPYHWRGERRLAEFNAAFSGLLGGTDLGAKQLEDFESFVFSLQAPANPLQQKSRNLTGTATSGALAGQTRFNTQVGVVPAFAAATCATCHGNESGSNGQITQDNPLSPVPTDTCLDVAHLRQLLVKIRQPSVPVTVGGTPTVRPRIGFGFAHSGHNLSLSDFLQPPAFVGFTPTELSQLVGFVSEFDQGIAPRVHSAVLMRAANHVSATADIQANFIPQATGSNPFLEIAVVGRQGGTDRQLVFQPATNTFLDQAGVTTTLAALDTAAAGGASFLFVMVAPGNSKRFALDPDNDGLDAVGEAAATTLAQRTDTDGDSFPDGYEVSIGTNPKAVTTLAQVQLAVQSRPLPSISSASLDYTTARMARFKVTYSEPCQVSVQLQRRVPGTPATFVNVGAPQIHPEFLSSGALVAQELRASIAGLPVEQYRFSVTLTDFAQRTATVPLSIVAQPDPTVLPSSAPGQAFPCLLTNSLTGSHPAGQPVTVTVTLSNLWSEFTTLFDLSPGNFVVAQVTVKNGSGAFNVVTPTPTGATMTGDAGALGSWGTEITGPLLVSPASVAGPAGTATATASLTFNMPPGTVAGTTVRVAIVGVSRTQPLPVTPGSSTTATRLFSPALDTAFWLMPLCAANTRVVEFTF